VYVPFLLLKLNGLPDCEDFANNIAFTHSSTIVGFVPANINDLDPLSAILKPEPDADSSGGSL
jgi:hypothetical protein